MQMKTREGIKLQTSLADCDAGIPIVRGCQSRQWHEWVALVWLNGQTAAIRQNPSRLILLSPVFKGRVYLISNYLCKMWPHHLKPPDPDWFWYYRQLRLAWRRLCDKSILNQIYKSRTCLKRSFELFRAVNQLSYKMWFHSLIIAQDDRKTFDDDDVMFGERQVVRYYIHRGIKLFGWTFLLYFIFVFEEPLNS